METTIVQEKYNPLIGRKEVDVLLTHLGEITPTRETVRTKIAALLNMDLKHVVIQSIQGHFGEPRSRVIVHCYDNADDVFVFEPKYRLRRNKIIDDDNKGKS